MKIKKSRADRRKYHFIYKTTNLLNGKYYIGLHSTDDLNDGYLGSGRRLKYSIAKYGKDNHKREILEFCKSRKELRSREAEIVNLNEIAKNECMNLITGGGTGNTTIPSAETIEKRRKAMIGQITTEETKQKISNTLKGRKHSPQRIKNISKGLKGVSSGPRSEETKQKIGDANRGRYSGIKKPIVKCPHCHKEGGYPSMKQWHFDNCKYLIKVD